ncbi:MAG TPA: hypothetical protein VMW41_02370 [Candidatus Bathyarchaeia archaeon]|nr:hypothetical protein [Candidatus Bathyarchaeia archaeon]
MHSKRCLLILILSSLLVSLVLIFPYLNRLIVNQNPESIPTTIPSPEETNNKQAFPNTIFKNVVLVIINPKDTNGIGTISKYNWHNPEELANQYLKTVRSVSDNTINYQIVKRINFNKFPIKKNGFIPDAQSYAKCLYETDADCREIIDYKAFFDDLSLCEDIRLGKISEVWTFGGPWFGFWEWSVKGPRINSNQENLPDCGGKTYTIMGFSYERSLTEMLEDLGHRFEYTMIQIPEVRQDWRKFTDGDHCGTVHVPPNATVNYDRSNTNPIESFCDDFHNYPNLLQKKTSFNCRAWDCTAYGYLTWWLGHIPNRQGKKNNVLNNWWLYVTDPDQFVR